MSKGSRRFMKHFRYGEKGFTLIELLVVVAILGVLAAVAVPNVGRFIKRGRDEAKATELHNIQTAVMALLADSDDGELDASYDDITDLSVVTAAGVAEDLADYVTGLDENDEVRTDSDYDIAYDGTVTQDDDTTPPAKP